MLTKSKKAKSRRLQDWVRDTCKKSLNIVLRCAIMGEKGRDLHHITGKRKFPYKIECKNQERVNVWESYDQACSFTGEEEPLLFIQKNRRRPLVIIDAEYFILLHRRYNGGYKKRDRQSSERNGENCD